MNKKERICIVGAGASGLSIAYYLKQKGYKNVTILEKNDRVGGKCQSIKYNGKMYEIGSAMGFDSNPHVLELMNAFGMKNRGPVLYRGFFDEQGNPISQIDVDEVEEFQEQFYRLPEILSQYGNIWEPGLKNVDPRLCVPFRQWLIDNEVPLVGKIYAPPFTGFGYGFFDEIAAIYVLKYLNFQILNSFIEITHLITLVEGSQELWGRMAAFLDNTRLNTNISKIKRDKKVMVQTNLDTLEYDKLILTCPLDESQKFLDVNEEERKLFSKIEYNDFYVFAYKLDNIPKVCGYIPSHFNREKIGHILVWYYRWQDMARNDLITVYAMGNDILTDKDVKDMVEEDLTNLGANIRGLYTYKKWRHFPHVSCEDLKDGYYDKLESLQSQNNTYYAGELMSFSILEECIAYAKVLVDLYF